MFCFKGCFFKFSLESKPFSVGLFIYIKVCIHMVTLQYVFNKCRWFLLYQLFLSEELLAEDRGAREEINGKEKEELYPAVSEAKGFTK